MILLITTISIFVILNEIKLWEGYQKLRSSHLLYHFNNRDDIGTRYDINNQKATITFFITLSPGVEIGVEIEDKQFRRFVYCDGAEAIAQRLLTRQLFFSSEFKGRGNRSFLSYGNDFRYQYERIENQTSFDDLFDRICEEFKIIRERRDEIIVCCND